MKKDFLYRTAEKIYERCIAGDRSGRRLSIQVKENLERLHPFSGKEKVREHYVQKIRLSMLIGFGGVFLAAGMALSGFMQPVIKENKIYRQDYNGDMREIPVRVTVGDKKEHELVLEIGERIYDDVQLKDMYEKMLPELEREILGENDSPEHVDTDMNLVKELPGFPFRIEWESRNYNLIDGNGKLQDTEIPATGTPTGLNAVITYEEFRAEYLIYVQVYPKVLTPEQSEEKRILESVKKSEEESREAEAVLLPSEFEGEELIWRSREDRTWMGILFLTICTTAVVYYLKDEDLKKAVKRREAQMRLEYPEIVSRLSIYLGAGMSVKAAWEKISVNRKPNPVYEEMRIACQEMKSGISETLAYERFGRRCGIQLYGKFSALLTQNLKKGSTRLGPLLKEESRYAFEERKNSARKAGEEAGTKLLLPMMMMLCVVMLMILLPAFMTF